ncbi:Crp/Fnr family transcriptional regulator [Solimonas sp. K1W22B-7]|uniref:Crp/Fnr family transcriptional regulator n=1 Tax=Solimonas sp. K1W22B-7 TaxID=2303331 RepID=UPI001F094671|nr:Crp/Fnr family transcriptional regulator [Solimonas sp. K1W22B-7]
MEEDRQQCQKSRIVRQSPWFAGLPAEALEQLQNSIRLRNVHGGQIIVARGMPLDSILGIVSGRMRLGAVSARGQEVNVGDLIAGGWFGDFSLYDDSPSPLDGTALEDSVLAVIPHRVVHEVGRRFPIIYREMHRDLLVRTRNLCDLFELVAAHPLAVRLAIRLLVLFQEHGKAIGNHSSKLTVRITQGELATLCYGTRQHINRLLCSWSEEGFISIRNDYIECSDFRRLVAKASLSGFAVT